MLSDQPVITSGIVVLHRRGAVKLSRVELEIWGRAVPG